MPNENENENTKTTDTGSEPENNEDEPTLFDAVSDAIDAETIDPEGADDETPDETSEEVEGEEAEGEEAEGEEAEGEEAEGEEAEGEEAEGEEAEDEPADPINDPIPKGLKKKTKERIQTLIEIGKGGEAATVERDELINHITDSGASAEQFGATLGWLTLYNSPRIEDRREALTVMQQAIDGLAQEIGEPVRGADVLASHKDLQDEVAEGALTQNRAEEIAAGRDRKTATAAATAAERTQTEQSLQTSAALKQGAADLNLLEVTLQANDPQYATKKAILLPALKSLMKTTHPSEWKVTFQTAYDGLNLPAKTPVPKPKEKKQQPLRPKKPAGQGKSAPTTMGGAIDAALDQFDNE